MRVGVIAGTGFSLGQGEPIEVDTPWGTRMVFHLHEGDRDLFLLQRHSGEVLAPHRISHRANVDALRRCGVEAIVALNAVGALDAAVPIPSLLVPHDLIDLRKTTETFHEERAVHVDMSEPYCPTLRTLLVRHASARDGGVYAATEGPRLETPAEVRMLRALGGDVVGMTGCPEAALARERAICYASLCLVVNHAAGVGHSPLTAHEIRRGAEALAPRAWAAALAAARGLPARRACGCWRALDAARL